MPPNQSPYGQQPQQTPPDSQLPPHPPTSEGFSAQHYSPPAHMQGEPEPVPNYDFITQLEHSPKKTLFNAQSMIGRVITLLVGLVGLIIVFAVVKGIISGGGPLNATALIGVVQEQQELLHLCTEASNTQNAQLSQNDQNLVASASLSIGSEQQNLIIYLKDNGQKLSSAQYLGKINAADDTTLTAAAADSTYDQVFNQIMQTQLGVYKQDLDSAYAGNKTARGRVLLRTDYQGAVLLLKQAGSPDS